MGEFVRQHEGGQQDPAGFARPALGVDLEYLGVDQFAERAELGLVAVLAAA